MNKKYFEDTKVSPGYRSISQIYFMDTNVSQHNVQRKTVELLKESKAKYNKNVLDKFRSVYV